MTRSEFEEMARNDPRGALVALFDELDRTQETVADLADALPKPEEQAPEQA